MNPIAITMGDPAGIGPEIIAKAFRDAADVTAGCFVAGDVATMRRAVGFITEPNLEQIALPVAQISTPAEAQSLPLRCLPVLQIGEQLSPVPIGIVSGLAGQMAAEAVLWATRATLRGDIAALVTAPLHKEALHAAGLPHSSFPGHTEMLQALAAEHAGKTVADMPVRMMLANDELRVVLVSIHMALLDAIRAITFDNVLQTLQISHASLSRTLGRPPRIGVAGLNPHAGEGGLFGREEIDIIAPAIAEARRTGIDAQGPFAPDTIFMRARASAGLGGDAKPGEFDAVVAMYHDQGLIPVKYLGVEQGVNVTLGLHGLDGKPLIRTSPDHGTAFDIAGSGKADASSLIEAIRMAKSMVFSTGRP